jgi:hypothetical protein
MFHFFFCKDLSDSNYEKLIRNLFSLEYVRYAVVLDDYGNRIVGGMNENVPSTTPADVERRLEVQCILILRMAESYQQYDGSLLYSSIRWEKLSAYFFLLSDKRVLALTVQGRAPLNFVEDIREVVKAFLKK